MPFEFNLCARYPEVLRCVAEEMHGEFVAALRSIMPNAATFPDPPAPPAPRPGEVEAQKAAVEAAASAGNYVSVMPTPQPQPPLSPSSADSGGGGGGIVAGIRSILKSKAGGGARTVAPDDENGMGGGSGGNGGDEILAGFELPAGPEAWSTRVSLKCSKEDALDASDAARSKAARYREDNAAEMSPLTMYSSYIVDCLRATVVCADSESMVHVMEALTRPKSPFEEVKFRNNLGALRRPYNLVFNAVFKPLFMPPLMVEISLIHHDVHQLVQMAERFEKISRAPDVEALRPAPALTCEAMHEARSGGRREITGANAEAGGFRPWSRIPDGVLFRS